MRIVKPNKYEFYFSIVIAVAGFLITARSHPEFSDAMIRSGSLIIGFVCAFNAVLDRKLMNWFEHALALVWFSVLLFFLPLIFWHDVLWEAFFHPYSYYSTHPSVFTR